MITKTIISRQTNGQISITYYDDRDNLNDIINKHITLRGNTLIEVIDGIVEKPETKEDRDCWDFKSGKIEVDAFKVQEKEDAVAIKESQKTAILSKLKITKEEFKHLNQ
jgi:hypothetical protein